MATFPDPVHDEFSSWLLGLAPYGGADIGEVDALVPLVKDGDDDSFYDACVATAKTRIAEGDAAAKAGHLQTAYDCFLRGALFLGVGYHVLYGTPVDPRLVDAFHLQMETFEKALRLGVVRAEPVDVPYEGTKIPAWLLRAVGHEDERGPCILVGGGWDSTMVENFLGIGAAALQRGYHVLLHDGPGQGKLLVDEGLTLRHDWEKVVTPVVDAALAIDVVDRDKLVYEPWSLGGYMAPRVAAYEHRLAAVIADPGQMDVGGKITGPLAMLGLSADAIAKLPELSAAHEKTIMDFFAGNRPFHWKIVQRGFWTNGGGDLSGWLAEMMKWKLTPEEIAAITTPMLITAAESDPVAAEAKALYDALPGAKTLLEFTDAEGAGMHCEMMNRSMANRRMLDWLDDTLGSGTQHVKFGRKRLDVSWGTLVTMQHPRHYAQTAPDRPAAIDADTGAIRTYAELDERANRLAHALRAADVQTGDHLAIVLDNRLEMFDALWGGMVSGLYVTPVNWHLAADEVQYIVDDCGASALVVAADATDTVAGLGDGARALRLAVGRELAGFDDFEGALAAQPTTPVEDEAEGSWMFYSSGTTGRPKGIKPPTIGGPLGEPNGFAALVGGIFGVTEGSVYLCPAPLYHSAPAGWSTTVHRLGGTVVAMHAFDAEACLAVIERYRVTHVQFVPTHLVRILKLDPEVRAKYDLSSLQLIVHAAAPCPPDVKRGAIEFFGPILHEYYAGSEGGGFCYINSEDWLAHPGSVGKPLLGAAHVADEDGNELPNGEAGQIWFESPNKFEYHGDKEKTAEAWNDRGWMTLGDVGYVDDEGYVFLTDRVSNMIISGGVNIYPRETEDVLIGHPAVHDVAVIGIPHPEMGESVRAVVQLAEPTDDPDAMSEELRKYCRDRLSHFKCPTSVVFVDVLPRLPSGKIAKRMFSDEARGLTPA